MGLPKGRRGEGSALPSFAGAFLSDIDIFTLLICCFSRVFFLTFPPLFEPGLYQSRRAKQPEACPPQL